MTKEVFANVGLREKLSHITENFEAQTNAILERTNQALDKTLTRSSDKIADTLRGDTGESLDLVEYYKNWDPDNAMGPFL